MSMQISLRWDLYKNPEPDSRNPDLESLTLTTCGLYKRSSDCNEHKGAPEACFGEDSVCAVWEQVFRNTLQWEPKESDSDTCLAVRAKVLKSDNDFMLSPADSNKERTYVTNLISLRTISSLYDEVLPNGEKEGKSGHAPQLYLTLQPLEKDGEMPKSLELGISNRGDLRFAESLEHYPHN